MKPGAAVGTLANRALHGTLRDRLWLHRAAAGNVLQSGLDEGVSVNAGMLEENENDG